jgi:putative tricarboxylic transport membrane protein
MRRLDISAAIILLALSVLVAADTWSLPYWSEFAPGPSFASLWLAGAGLLVGGSLLLQALTAKSFATAEWPDRTGLRQVLLGIAALWAIIVVLPFLGTALSGLLFMLFFLLGVARRPWLPSVFTAVCTVAVIEGVFGFWLKVDLPAGYIGF